MIAWRKLGSFLSRRGIFFSLLRKSLSWRFEAESSAALSLARRQTFEPFGNLAHLFGQAKEHQPIFLGQFAQPQIGHMGKYATNRDYPFRTAGVDEYLCARHRETAEYGIERCHRGRDDDLRTRLACTHIEPRKERGDIRTCLCAIHQHQIAQCT